ncbi:MAG: DEAD/DEAH box helicase family protein [Rhizobiaceae bacterium]
MSNLPDVATKDQDYDASRLINEIRSHVANWRRIPNPTDWGVSPTTAKLLRHWREFDFQGIRPFFCQVEAVETIIWLTEVAPKQRAHKWIWDQLKSVNKEANPEILRLAMKMATGAGKTTVMAMIIAWQTLNSVRSPTSKQFTRGFLLVAPGITIRDRLRVLLPSDPDSYYKTRDLLPPDMLTDMGKAKIVITNYHAFGLREKLETNKVGRSMLQGRGEELQTKESEGEMIRRVAKDLMGLKNIIVINDEAHHCYREKPDNDSVSDLTGDEKKHAQEENKAARLWINGLEAFKRKLGVSAVYDLSATPFFLSGSGYQEGTLFPWVVSDFSLMDAIESGIVKLPRVPVSDNHIAISEMPVFRDLWAHIGKDMPKKGRGSGLEPDPQDLPDKLKTALNALYSHYVETDDAWVRAGIDIPPVFIVVCNNTATSKLVYEWISGWQRPNDDGDLVFKKNGSLELFRNFDEHGNAIARPPTLLIDSMQLESGEALDKNFRKMAEVEIEQFKREMAQREGAASLGDISDAELLREAMNTVGKKGRLGEKIRCVVSVSMLTEGWDTNNVTHILGVRAFGTQLLCEQVVGRGLRRLSYQLNEDGLFDVEYSDILGIPFDFTAKPQVAKPKAPKKTEHIRSVPERVKQELTFPRVVGYRVELPEERLTANFNENSSLTLDIEAIGPGKTRLEGIVGEGITISAAEAKNERPSTIAFKLARTLMVTHFKDNNGDPKMHLYGQLKRICRQWINDGWLTCPPGTGAWMLEYPSVAGQACERIYNAIINASDDEPVVKAVLDPYNATGSTSHVSFQTTKAVYKSNPERCQINYVVLDSGWEEEMARVAEEHPNVIRYVKNQGLGFEIPYKDGATPRVYVPDFIIDLNDGNGPDDPLHLVVEIKGYRNENVKVKSETTKQKWIKGVNNLGHFGRWDFVEFQEAQLIESEFKALIDAALTKTRGQE